MSDLNIVKQLPISDTEECIPHKARPDKSSSAQPRLQMIEEEEPSHTEMELPSYSDSLSSSSSTSTTSTSSSLTASGVHKEEPKNEIPKDVLEYVEKIREAIHTQRDRTVGEKSVEPTASMNVESKPTDIPVRKRAASLSVLGERTKAALTKLTDRRKKAVTSIVAKSRTKAYVESKSEPAKEHSVLIGSTKIGRVQYIHEDKKARPISLIAACDSIFEREGGSPLKNSYTEDDGGESKYLCNVSTTNTRPKYDLRTGRNLGESRSLRDRLLDLAIVTRRSAVNGIETVKGQTSSVLRPGKGKWSKLD